MYYGLDKMPESGWYMSSDNGMDWKSGSTYLTAGESRGATKLPMGAKPYPTYYFRKNLYLPDTTDIINITFQIDYDDDYILFLNGREIATSQQKLNWNDHGSYGHKLHNSLLDGGTQGQGYTTVHLTGSQLSHLRNGDNLVAVAIKQHEEISSDAAFTLSASGWVRSYTSQNLEEFYMSLDNDTIATWSIAFSVLMVLCSMAYVHIRLKQR